jgi:hypothetical protein
MLEDQPVTPHTSSQNFSRARDLDDEKRETIIFVLFHLRVIASQIAALPENNFACGEYTTKAIVSQ